ncbi:MAG: DUF2194 domain-containing protein, partial [Dehalococcoidia bacterium]|nr:DUF2194 domain-containing protein [Dehalococcoidia bacterium]
MWFIRLLVPGLLILALIAPPAGAEDEAHVAEAAVTAVPMRLAILTDEGTGGDSELMRSLNRILTVNRLPFDVLDVSAGQTHEFLNGEANPSYAALLVQASGEKIDQANSEAIVEAVNRGMGLVGLGPASVNAELSSVFGIAQMRTEARTAQSIRIEEDRFTFAYAGDILYGAFTYFEHILRPGAQIVAVITYAGQAAIWTDSHGAGKTVFHNNSNTSASHYQGILLQSILYAMPVGLASPISAGVIEVDDYPRSYYTDDQVREHHYDFITNFTRWLHAYNLTTTVFIAFSYSGNIDDYWIRPESLEGAHTVLSAGHELGLHCGSSHYPLDITYWNTEAAIDAEVDATMEALALLRERLLDVYGTELGDVISYVAPMNDIGDYGYIALDQRSDIKYVGTDFYSASVEGAGTASAGQDRGKPAMRRSGEDRPRDSRGEFADAATTVQYHVTYRDFGWEPGTNIYNLPRVQGDFYPFNQPQDPAYAYAWGVLKSTIESGQPYLIFTHPDEADYLDKSRFPDSDMEGVFEAYTAWADFVAEEYPFYRWWTSSKLGNYMTERSGSLAAQWFPGEMTLELSGASGEDAIHIKTDLYLADISSYGDGISLVFQAEPAGFATIEYDVVKTAGDYFIYPTGTKSFLPVIPDTPFVFESWAGPENRAPVLNPIGDKTAAA